MTSEPLEPDTQAQHSSEDSSDEDYYMDGPYVVFTASFHRKRGFCCASGCRHCPYNETNDASAAAGE